MIKIVVFGAGGRAGRRAVAEAVARGHQVSAVVRDPARHQDLAGDGVTVVTGDVTRAGSVAEVARGHDVAINAAYQSDMSSEEFFVGAARALLDGLARAEVGRLLAVGIGTTLETAPGVRVMDAPGFPEDARVFSLGHVSELETFRAAETGLDWVVVAPPPVVLTDDVPPTGRYRTAVGELPPGGGAGPFSYADLAVALLDEIETPKHHRVLLGVAP
ncbi:NAD(P)-dependent oxidoreductase [Sphaerisporangium corydalis]|uniref:NAD(P)-dependent oxidoreductase n=1 Tax=Sphaerisporangium corydalis TaxID=1441875 RepID=A0ABV9ERP1_9ACTN|nr:NAD(P)H-binding protein [Sphaerisporangium corydalis]